MSIRDIKEAKEMRECFKKISGREGISRRAIEIFKKVGDNERMAAFAIGRILRLAQVAKEDDYWTEKINIGKTKEYYAIKQAAKNKGDFNKAVDAAGDDVL